MIKQCRNSLVQFLDFGSIRTMKRLLVALAVLSFAHICSGQLLQNGGFEDATLAPWVGSGDINMSRGGNGAFEGTAFANLSFTGPFAAQSFTFSQAFNLGAATPVTLIFYAQRYDSGGFDDTALTFTARIDGIVLSMTLPPFSGTTVLAGNWLRYEITTPSALSAGSHTLAFDYSRGGTGFGRSPGLALDAVSLAPVPEPSVPLLLVSAGAIAFALRRFARNSAS